MKHFEKYLQDKGFAQSTIQQHQANLQRFQQWCYQENIFPTQASYSDLLTYIDYMQQQNLSVSTINIRLRALDHYYAALRRKDNPARDLRIRGTRTKALPPILSPTQLEEVFQAYLNKPATTFKGELSPLVHQRNLVVLSLLIYQGLHTGELARIKVADADLVKGLLYVPAGYRGDRRTLKLHSLQLLLLRQYIGPVRNRLLQIKGIDSKTDRLFDITKLRQIHSLVYWLMGNLKTFTGGLVQSAYQIRVSVLMQWLKQEDVRIVQHRIGHRQISTTQRFQDQDLEDLQTQLQKYHPWK